MLHLKNCLFILFISMLSPAFGQVGENISIGTKHRIASKILNEEREYQLYIPESYNNSTKKYPVVVILDGDYHFHAASGMVEYLSKEAKIPEMIVVSVLNTDRTRDFTPSNTLIDYNGKTEKTQATSGGASKFLSFLENELLLDIDKNYRVNGFRILTGHSMGGLLSAYAFLDENSTFKAFIAIDPSFWWDNQMIIGQIDSAKINTLNHKKLYISTADNHERSGYITHARNSQELFYASLKNSGFRHDNIKFDYFEQETHGTVPLLSFYNALAFIFQNFNLDGIYDKSAKEIQSHYQQLSKKLGTTFLPPENIVNSVAYYQLYHGNNIANALELFEMNVGNYPNSFNVYDSLGEAHKVVGNKKEALRNYRLSVKLNPKNENGKKMIELLNK